MVLGKINIIAPALLDLPGTPIWNKIKLISMETSARIHAFPKVVFESQIPVLYSVGQKAKFWNMNSSVWASQDSFF